VLATTLLAYPLALVFRGASPRVQRLLIFIILMPLLTSVVIRTFAWIVILAREGVLNQTLIGLGLTATPLNLLQTELGLVIALTQIEMPLMLLPLLTIMNQMDQNLVDASRALGASKWRTFFRVILPLTLPGWIAGATLVFASATTAFISQSVIGGARLVYLPSLIWQQSMVVYNWPFAAVASLTLLFTVLAGIMALGWLGRFARTS
jgi:putative spermidine/putrescine transport system permease protein